MLRSILSSPSALQRLELPHHWPSRCCGVQPAAKPGLSLMLFKERMCLGLARGCRHNPE